tara:strand:- start:1501 stop:1992 length:492 start_codon:yes stop_codon:yes gene_type:complete
MQVTVAPLHTVSLDKFKKFLKSMTIERESWSLMKGPNNTVDDLYNKYNNKFIDNALIISKDDTAEIIGFSNSLYLNEDDSKMLYVKIMEAFEISIVILKQFQRLGLASMLLKEMEKSLLKFGGKHIIARVSSDNIASNKLFDKLGYTSVYSDIDNFNYKHKRI